MLWMAQVSNKMHWASSLVMPLKEVCEAVIQRPLQRPSTATNKS